MNIHASMFGSKPPPTPPTKKLSVAERVPPEIWQRVIRLAKEDVPSENEGTATHLSLAIPSAFRALAPERRVERAQKKAFAFVNGQTHKKWGMFASTDHPALEQTELALLEKGQTLHLNGLACRRPIRVREQSSNYEMDLREWTYTLRDAVMSAEQRRNFSFLVQNLAQHLVVLDLSYTRVSLLYGMKEGDTISDLEVRYFSSFGWCRVNQENIRRDFSAMTSLQRLTLRGRQIDPAFVGALPLESLRLLSLDICFTSFRCLFAIDRDASVQEIIADDLQVLFGQNENMFRKALWSWAIPQATTRISLKTKDSFLRPMYAGRWEHLDQEVSSAQVVRF